MWSGYAMKIFAWGAVLSLLLPPVFSSPAFSQATSITNLEAIFIVDESRSMVGEHNFLQQFVPDFSNSLNTMGISSVYGLVGYGHDDPAPRKIIVGPGDFGTADEFTMAAKTLRLSKLPENIEDGYVAIDHALRNYTFTIDNKTARIVVLVTDEERGVIDTTVSLQSVQQFLNTLGVTWNGIFDQEVFNQANVAAVGANATTTYTDVNKDGVPEESTAPVLGGASGETRRDYGYPVLDGGGCMADLFVLRDGGTAATAFSSALTRCLSGVVQAGRRLPPVFVAAIPVAPSAFNLMHFNALLMRMNGRLHGAETGSGIGGSASRTTVGAASSGLKNSLVAGLSGSGAGVITRVEAGWGTESFGILGRVRFFMIGGGNFSDV
jgi:hypothetical protein